MPKHEVVDFQVDNGVTIRGDAWGEPSDDPVLLLHGGGQTRHAWGSTAKELAKHGWYAIALDLRGHGDSDWDPNGDYTVNHFKQDLLTISATFSKKPSLVGASLGGITGMLAQGESDETFLNSLVLVDITPKIEKQGTERIIAFMTANPDGFASLDEAADTIAKYLPNRPKRSDNSGLAKNLKKDADGRYRWHWDPELLRSLDTDRFDEDHRLENAAKNLTLPTLLIRGKASDIVSKEGAEEFRDLVPHAEHVDVSGAGHMVAGDSNSIFTDAVVNFLEKHHPK